MRVAVIGTGYVGLVAGACFADTGHDVTCVDADERKVHALEQGQLPIYEEGLSDVVQRCVQDGRLHFTRDPADAVPQAQVVFIAVGTPAGLDGHADLSDVFAAARTVAQLARGRILLVLKSTVPVRTNERVTQLLHKLGASHVEVVSNPEFLKEGAALEDFRRPDRVVVGVRSTSAAELMRQLYEPYLRTGAPFLVMDPASAELAKYASNAMLATRISFMNSVANLCESVGADVEQVRRAVGADRRIGHTFLFPGVGYGGSCFPKDVRALSSTAREQGRPFALLDEVERVNEAQKRVLADKVLAAFEPEAGVAGRRIALWGLAFKANTDDLREAPALTIVDVLVRAGAQIAAHDPVAMDKARELLAAGHERGDVHFARTMYDALDGADALVIATEWPVYRRPDFERVRALLRRPWVFDGRNLWDAQKVARLGLVYRSIGRPDALPSSGID